MHKLRVSLVGLFLLGAAQVLAACGSDVTNNGQGGAGAGGSGGTGGAAPGDARQVCMDYCHVGEVNNCGMQLGDCNAFCDEAFADIPPECEDQFGALFACYIPAAKDCPNDPPPECNDEQEAALMCQMANGCLEAECFAGAGPNGESSCGCSSTCKGEPYSTSCETPANGGMTTCTCTTGDAVVGTCTNPDAETCGPQTSCCAELFNL
ncbi:hypothetical protein [Polyangium fumosum]|uniref:Uncharacterized protein n=1 Tax=Polyangium fumosum TaxID=889272 RepID=A0A4U1J9P8_9BACT|nr:hypothetical protein [Polyangium fumosum]TKD04553.1 hypothetical protein E8A74_23395 [Polyangium fumosum]